MIQHTVAPPGLWDSVIAGINFPATLWAVMTVGLSVLGAMVLTQGAKPILPRSWPMARREAITRYAAMVFSFGICVALLPTLLGGILGLISALFAPRAYKVVVSLLYLRWPGLKDVLPLKDSE